MSPDPAHTEFQLGEIVNLRANPTIQGAIIQTIPSTPENRYILFIEGKTATYYASQLLAPKVEMSTPILLPLQEFLPRQTALQIRGREPVF